ncbi:MAG: hypothetical protein NZ951_04465 [Dehalococcoidia bacterium]|nr:hypothetical protein [Dehalococcoidia bacterium]MDW8120363.1 hypothetical protein [Chloroflexota bacterium]
MPRKTRRGRRPRFLNTPAPTGTATLPPKPSAPAPETPRPALSPSLRPPPGAPSMRLPIGRELAAVGIVAGMCLAILLVLWLLLR